MVLIRCKLLDGASVTSNTYKATTTDYTFYRDQYLNIVDPEDIEFFKARPNDYEVLNTVASVVEEVKETVEEIVETVKPRKKKSQEE